MEAVGERDQAIHWTIFLNKQQSAIDKVSKHIKQPEVAVIEVVEEEIIYQLQGESNKNIFYWTELNIEVEVVVQRWACYQIV